MTFVDYYKILGIDKTATPKDIKNAYRKLARKHHPDLNPNDKDAKRNFQQINEANEVLSDPEKRKKYDQYERTGSMLKSLINKSSHMINLRVRVGQGILRRNPKGIFQVFLNLCLVGHQAEVEAGR